MKKYFVSRTFLPALVLAISLFTATTSFAQPQVAAPVTYQTFYDELSPYGTWIDYPSYGHVWHPSVSGDFRPYLTNGYWNYSTEGSMWMSNYNWGWAPFHYGRWVYDDSYGWLWIPGYEWSPAWVTWGSVDNFYAWAPLMPEVNVGIAFSLWRPPAFYWNSVGREHIYDHDIYKIAERREAVANYAGRITVINNFTTTRFHNQYYAKGPDASEVERYTNRKIEPAIIREGTARQSRQTGNEVQVYRPAVNNPQPREYRRIENGNTNPVRTNDDRTTTEQNRQGENVNNLPVHKAPESGNNRSRGDGGDRKNKRN